MKNLKPLFTILMCAVFGLTLTMLYTSCVSSAESEDLISYDYDYDFTYEDEVFVLDEGIPGKILEIPLDEFTLQEVDVAGSQDPSDPKYGSSYNPETHVLVSNGGAGFGRWWPHIEASEYNSVKIQYKVKEGCSFGTIFAIAYAVSETENYDVAYYIPSYMTEFEIPLIDDKKGEISGFYTYTWGRPGMNTEIEFKSITLQTKKIKGPTNPNYTTQATVTDTGTQVAFNDDISSIDLVADMGAGLQLQFYFSTQGHEYDWGMDHKCVNTHPEKLTRANIQKIKADGFKTIRLDVCFGSHMMGSKNTVDPRFMAEVKEVVDMCIDEDLYVVISDFYSSKYTTRTDAYYFRGFSLQPELEEESTAFVICLWKQIALAFNNSYDEHLLFEFINEPNSGPDGSTDWGLTGDEQFRLVKKYNQLILDAIRSSGGNNAKRFCVVESICGSAGNLCDNRFRLPADSADDKLIACFHSYPMGNQSNYNSSSFQRFGNDALTQETAKINAVYNAYVAKGIGVINSEYGTNRDAPLKERLECIEGTISAFYAKGISVLLVGWQPDYFDFVTNNWHEDDGEIVKLFISIANNTTRPESPTAAINKYSGTPTMLGKELLTEPLVCPDTCNWFYCNGNTLGYLPDTVKVQIKAEPVGTGEHYVKVHTGYFVGANNWNDLFTLTDDKITGGTAYTGKPHQRKITGATTITYQLDGTHADNISSFGLHLEGMNVKVTSIKIVQ